MFRLRIDGVIVDSSNMENNGQEFLSNAIRNSTALSFAEFSVHQESVCATSPEFLVKTIPRLIFRDIYDSINATKSAIDLIKFHPSLPVSFDVNGSIGTLLDYLHKQETFLTLVKMDSVVFRVDDWNSFREDTLTESASKLAARGHIEQLSTVLKRHVTEIWNNCNPVTDLIAVCPFDSRTEGGFISMIKECVIPNVYGLSDLAQVLVTRARQAGITAEPEVGLALLSVLDDHSVVNRELERTPLESIREVVRYSETPEVHEIVEGVRSVLQVLVSAKSEFGIPVNGGNSMSFEALEHGREGCLERVASDILIVTGNMDQFSHFCDRFNVNKDKLLANQLIAVKEQVLCNYKRARVSMDTDDAAEEDTSNTVSTESLLEVMYSLISEIRDRDLKMDCMYSALTAVHSLNVSGADSDRFEELARTLVAESPDTMSLLSLYLSVTSVQKLLVGFPQFEFIKQRPDFLMKQDNVMAVAAELASMGELSTVEALSSLFPYISIDEMRLVRLSCQYFELRSEFIADHISGILDVLGSGCSDFVLERFLNVVLSEQFGEAELHLTDAVLGHMADRIPPHQVSAIKKLRLLWTDFGRSECGQTIASSEWESVETFTNMLGVMTDLVNQAKLERARVVFSLQGEKTDPENESEVKKLISEVQSVNLRTVSRGSLIELLNKANETLLSMDDKDLLISSLIEEVVMPLQSLLLVCQGNSEWSIVSPNEWTESASSLCPSLGEVLGVPVSEIPRTVARAIESRPYGPSDELMILNSISSHTMEVDPSKISEFDRMEKVVRLHAFTQSVGMRDLVPDIVRMSDRSENDMGEGIIQTGQSVLANRAMWGSVLESFSIAFSRDALLNSIDTTDSAQKKNLKQILNDCFPSLVTKSGFDVQLAKRFGKDFGRSEMDVLIKVLEIVLVTSSEWKEKSKCTLIELLNLGRDKEVIEKLATFILPAIQRDDQIRWLVSTINAHSPIVWQREDHIIATIDELGLSDGAVKDCLNVSTGPKIAIDVLTKQLSSPSALETAMRLARLVADEQTLVRFVTETVKKISAYPDLVQQVDMGALISIVEAILGNSEDGAGRAFKSLLQALPLSGQQLQLGRHFSEHYKGISEADLRLLENRLVLKKYNVPSTVETKMKEFNFSLKRLIEFIFFNHKFVDRHEELVQELIALNQVDSVKVRIDIAKKWIQDGYDGLTEIGGLKNSDNKEVHAYLSQEGLELVDRVVAVLTPIASEKPELISTLLLKLYFAQNVSLTNKLCCFDIVLRLVPKKSVMDVYHNSLSDLVEIQKNLAHLHLLSERNRVIKPMEYKDFATLNKLLVCKNLLNAGKAEYVVLASMIMADYVLSDFQVIEKLEERIKVHFSGMNASRLLKQFQTRMENSGVWYKVSDIPENLEKAPIAVHPLSDENVLIN